MTKYYKIPDNGEIAERYQGAGRGRVRIKKGKIADVILNFCYLKEDCDSCLALGYEDDECVQCKITPNRTIEIIQD